MLFLNSVTFHQFVARIQKIFFDVFGSKLIQFCLLKNIRWIASEARALTITETNYEFWFLIWTQSYMGQEKGRLTSAH